MEARRNLAFRYGRFKSYPDINEIPAMERTRYPLMALGLPKGSVLDAHEIFKAWMHVVPVAGFPDICVARKKNLLVIAVYVYKPFQRGARRYWKELVEEYRQGRR